MDRILVLQLKRIGDLVLTAPLTAALRAAFPDAHIALVTRGASNALAPLLPGVDECLCHQPGRPNFPLWARLSCGGWDVVLDVTGNDRSALMALVSRAPRKVTYERHCQGSGMRDRLYDFQSPASVRELHTVDYHLALLDTLGIDRAGAEASVDLRVPEGVDADAMRARVEAAAGGRPLAVVHPGTVARDKYWVAARWGEVIDHLKRDLGYTVALSCGPDEFEQSHAAEVVAASKDGVDFHEPTSMRELLVLLDAADLVVSVDTAVMHFAGALRKRQVALFGPTNPYHWLPRHPGSRIVVAGTPGAAGEFVPRHPRLPMEKIAVADVLSAIDELLGF